MSELTLSLAKTTRPTLSQVVRRPRLTKKLEPADTTARILWIAAPPGSGKTTLIADFVERSSLPVLWYQIDSADADVPTFCYYLRRTALKHCRRDISLAPLPRQGSHWAGYLTLLMREIFSAFGGSLIIVFDNYDCRPMFAELNTALAESCSQVPRGAMIVFGSREQPPGEFSRLRLDGDLELMAGDLLRLDYDELRELATQRHCKCKPAELNEIHRVAQGWAAGSVLLLEYARNHPDWLHQALDDDGNLMFEYLASEIFAGFDDATRSFLLDICWVRCIERQILAELSSQPHGERILTNLALNNYFVTERSAVAQREYILHPMLRRFLQQQCRRMRSADAVKQQQAHSARLLARAGQPEEAIELLSANADWPGLEAVIRSHAPGLLQEGRASMVGCWVEELPTERLEQDGWLRYWLGCARVQRSAREARICFSRAFRTFMQRRTDERRGALLAALGVVEAIILEQDDLTLLDEWLQIIDDQKPRAEEIEQAGAGLVMLILAAVIRNRELQHQGEILNIATAAAAALENAVSRAQTATRLALVHTLFGRIDWADDVITRYLTESGTKAAPGIASHGFLVGALIALVRGDAAQANALARQADELAQGPDSTEVHCLASALLCCASFAQADVASGERFLERLAGQVSPGMRTAFFVFNYLSSWRALLRDDPGSALSFQKIASIAAAELGNQVFEIMAGAALAQLHFRAGDSRAGKAQLRRVRGLVRGKQNPMLECFTLLIYGNAALDQSRPTSGLNAIRYALGLARQNRYLTIPWWSDDDLASLCETALEHGIEVAYVQDLIVRRRLTSRQPPMAISAWPWPLAIHALGEFTIERRGNVENLGRKAHGRPYKLLKVLIALGASNVPAADVAEVLWPHVDAEYALKSLTTNLHRLRRQLGDDAAVVLSDNRLTLAAECVALDTRIFAHVIDASGQLGSGNSHAEDRAERARDLMNMLLRVYRGPFLDGETDDVGINGVRDSFRRQFGAAMTGLCKAMSRAGDLASAIDGARRAIEQDPDAEELYILLGKLYLEQGDSQSTRLLIDRYDARFPNDSARQKVADIDVLRAAVS